MRVDPETGEVLSDGMDERAEQLGVTSLNTVWQQADRDADEYATLWSMFGPSGTYDNLRKAMLCGIAVQIRESAKKKDERVTDKMVDDYSHIDPTYKQYLQSATEDRKRYILLQMQRERAEIETNRGQALLRLAAAPTASGAL
jgi:hypothetical protein